MKVMCLETMDGGGVLAYAGLGATPGGTQPSAWMSAVLRDRAGLSFEQALSLLSDVANRELPPYLPQVGGAHFIIVPAFVKGVGPRSYTIDNVIDPATKQHRYRYTSRFADVPGSPANRLAAAGSGAHYLAAKLDSWGRPLLSLVNAHDRGRVSDLVVADRLASLNYETHQHDATVGPRCIVVWRRRPEVGPTAGGGGHQFYTGTDRDEHSLPIPIPMITNGIDVQAALGVLMPEMIRALRPLDSEVAVDLDTNEINRRLADLPDGPDEKLR